MICITFGRLPADYEDRLENMILTLPQSRAEMLKKRKNKTEYAVSVFSSAALYEFAEKYTGKPRDTIITDYDKNGKPFFRDLPFLHFSVSHSFPYYAVSFSDKPTGADIEFLRDINPKLAKRMFIENENRYFDGGAERFFEIWTKKEAYSKYTGNGIAEGFRSFDVLSQPISNNLFFCRFEDAFLSVYSERKIGDEIIEILFLNQGGKPCLTQR
ncbi:MAG: 4'-phosphopantetheinyl transferase superfamily protein [Clostridia bacterium]|nr:4'-phosphopantetheinyl transferase superfamily protein [Clostridia bacterium]